MAAPEKYDMTVYPVQVAVRSASDGAAVHMVTLPHCDCADFTNRKGKLTAEGQYISVCKHIVTAMQSVGGWHQPEPGPGERTVYGLLRAEARGILVSAEAGQLSGRTADVLLKAAVADGTAKDGTVQVTCHLGKRSPHTFDITY